MFVENKCFNNGPYGLLNSINPSSKDFFFLQCVEKLSEKKRNKVDSIGQTVLGIFKLSLQTKSSLASEITKETCSPAITKAIMISEGVSVVLTKKRAEEIKDKFKKDYGYFQLPVLQLLNIAKMCIVENEDQKSKKSIFVRSNDPEIDGKILSKLYRFQGLRLELALLQEVLPCLPLKQNQAAAFILRNREEVWGNLGSTVLQNYPALEGCKNLTMQQFIICLVATLRGLGAVFNPTVEFKKFALENKNSQFLISRSDSKYLRRLLSFYKENVKTNDETKDNMMLSGYSMFQAIKA